MAWPAPHRRVVDGLQNSIYEGTFVLPLGVEVRDQKATTTLVGAIDYAACSNICIPSTPTCR